MKSTLSVLFSLIIMVMMIACGNDSNNGGTSENSDINGNDTIKDSQSSDSVKKSEPRIDSLSGNCTAEQAMSHMKNSGHWDQYSTGIIPSIVNQHLPYARKLINNKYKHFIIVDKGSMQVILYDKYGNLKLNYKMACGRNYGHKRKKADCRTPEGIFECGGWFDSTDWLYTNDWGYTSPARGQFGPRFIRVCPQIGIHGTTARYSIGNRCSHGCIRIQNENVLELVEFVEKGMPIIVNPGPRDIAANKQNGVDMPALDLPNIPVAKSQEANASTTTKKKNDKKKETTPKKDKKEKSSKPESAKKESTNNNTNSVDNPKTTKQQEAKPQNNEQEQKGAPKKEAKKEPKQESKPKAPEKKTEAPTNE